MSLESRRVVLALTLTPVGPRRQSLDDQVLALHIAAAYHPDGLKELSADQVNELRGLAQKELLPWVWGPETLTVLAMPLSGVTPPAGAVLPLVLNTELLPAGQRTPILRAAGVDAVRKTAVEPVLQMPPEYLLWDPKDAMSQDDDATARSSRLIEDLATFSTLWGGVPEALGVTLYFKIKLSSEQCWLKARDFAVIAAPHYRDAAHQQAAAPKTDFRFLDLKDGESTALWQHGWSYAAQTAWPQGPREISALSKPLIVHPNPTRFDVEPMAAQIALGLDFGTYWVHAVAAKPWLDRLDSICSQLADPFARLCEAYQAVKQQAGPEQHEAWQRLLLLAAASSGLWPLRVMKSGRTEPDRELEDELTKLLSLSSFDPLQREVEGLVTALAKTAPLPSGEPHGLQRFLSVVRVGMGGAALADDADRATVHTALAAAVEALISQPGRVDLVCLWVCEHLIEQLRKQGVLRPPSGSDAARLAQQLRALLGLPQEGTTDADPEEPERGPLYQRRLTTGRVLRECAAQIAKKDPVADAALKWFTAKLSEQPDSLRTEILAITNEQWPTLFWSPIKDQHGTYVSRFMGKLRGEILETEVPETLPGGLTVQLDLPDADRGQGANSDDDSWRKLAGVGMLVRKAGAGNRWHLASAARVLWQADPEPVSLFDTPAVVPSRLGHSGAQGALRCPVLTYSQQSLIAANPLVEAAGRNFEIKNPGANDQDVEAAFTYEAVLDGKGAQPDRHKLLRLRFGQSYEVACFMVDTAGGLPDRLTAGAGAQEPLPYAFRPDWPGLDGASHSTEFPTVTIPYFRRVPVGEPRLRPGASGPRSTWPIVPSGCQPLLWEVEPQQSTKQTTSRAPLILLGAKTDTSFAFRIQPPSVDREVLERWGLPAPHERDSLKQILTGYFRGLAQLADASEEQLRDGLSLDDPAVTAIRIKVERYGWGADNRATGWASVPELPTSDLSVNRQADRVQELCDYQHPGLGVSCKVGEQFKLSTGAAYELTVPPGELVRLRVYALVPTRFVEGQEARFASCLFKDRESGAPLPHDAQHYELPPVELLIETASAELPNPVELWSALSLRCSEPSSAEGPAAQRSIEVRLAPTSSGAAKLLAQFRNIARVELLMQQWRWTGRPQPAPHALLLGEAWPSRTVQEPEDIMTPPYQKWELESFAGLSPDQESLRVPIPYVGGMWQTPGPASDERAVPEPIWKEEIRDHRAQLWRFAVRVHSRYAPLLVSEFRIAASKVNAEEKQQTDSLLSNLRSLDGWLWKRAFFPFQPFRPSQTPLSSLTLAQTEEATVPRPLVKAVIPLTAVLDGSTASAAAQAPALASPLLVVLDSAAFSSCGITERLEARIETVELPPSASAPGSFHQYGPDPIMSIDAAPYHGTGTQISPAFGKMEGPIGYTFDTDARQECYAHSAYVLPPFSGAQAWDFALISLRRRSGNAAVDEKAALSWTAPLWVQFPPSADFADFADRNGELVPRWHGSSQDPSIEFHLREQAGRHQGRHEDAPIPQYWLILTTQITDYSGQRVEKYEGVVQLQRQDRVWKTVDKVKDRPHLVRLVEVQTSNPLPTATERLTSSNFWKLLLPAAPASGEAPPDVCYRIVRVSQALRLVDAALS